MRKMVLIICAIFILILLSQNYDTEEIIIPNEAIRIRVIANSNSIEDQRLKKRVKDSIQLELTKMLKDATSIEEVRIILKENLGDVEYTVNTVLENSLNKVTTFDVNYGYNYFPQKQYKGINYNEGFYESIVIKLGTGQGDNWWCVLFPPLCLMDENIDNIEEVEYKSFVKELIDKYF